MATTKGTRDAIYGILNTMAAVSGTTKTAANHMPRGIADYEGYVIRVRMANSNNRRPHRTQRTEAHAWFIEVFSPKYDIGFYDEVEDDMYDYRDAVLTAFERDTTLSTAGLAGARIVTDSFQWGIETQYGFRHVWTATLSVENRVAC